MISKYDNELIRVTAGDSLGIRTRGKSNDLEVYP